MMAVKAKRSERAGELSAAFCVSPEAPVATLQQQPLHGAMRWLTAIPRGPFRPNHFMTNSRQYRYLCCSQTQVWAIRQDI
jgi:hypothetical protein